MVENMLAVAAEGAHEAAEVSAWGFDPGGWVALAMVAVFVIMLRMKVPALIAGALDKQIAGIRQQLDEAANLRKEAEALKAEYEAKLNALDDDAAVLKAAASREADDIIKQAKLDAAALIVRREKMAEEKIGAAERRAVEELRAKAAELAAVAARDLISKNHGAKADQALVDAAIANL
jgi:F-type H+-transporting ATPase subunit b